MKLIASFDAAIQNLGICYIEFDDEWRSKVSTYINSLHILYDQMETMSTNDFLSKASDIIKEIHLFVDNIIRIKFFNVVDLIPGAKARTVPMLERTKRLKYLLNCIDQQLPSPDIVLIEYQMKQNDISRTISNQIAMHYIDEGSNIFIEHKSSSRQRKSLIENVKGEKKLTDNSITYAVEKHSLMPILMKSTSKLRRSTTINKIAHSPEITELVGPTLKNTAHVMPDGEYANFIVKWSNYVANKKHTSANFKYYAKAFDIDLSGINNKLDDIADGFMMVFAWLVKKKMI